MLKETNVLRSELGNLAWDCQSGWLGSDGISEWSAEDIERTAGNIVDSLNDSYVKKFDSKVKSSLIKIVDHYWTTEHDHCEENSYPIDHIFYALNNIMNWLEYNNTRIETQKDGGNAHESK